MNPGDDRQTPRPMAQAIIDLIDWSRVRSVMDPCRGSGAFYDQFPRGHRKAWCEIQLKYTAAYSSWPRNYLNRRHPPVDLALSNVPFSLAPQFIYQALTHARSIVFLCRLSLLGSAERTDLWNEQWPPATHLITANPRASFIGGAGSTDTMDTALFCWDYHGVVRAPTGRAISQFTWDKPGRRKAA